MFVGDHSTACFICFMFLTDRSLNILFWDQRLFAQFNVLIFSLVSKQLTLVMLAASSTQVFFDVGQSLEIFSPQNQDDIRSPLVDNRIQRKVVRIKSRKMPLLLVGLGIVFLIIVCGLYLFLNNQNREHFKEFSCHKEDTGCRTMLCPAGMQWNEDDGECLLPAGYICCLDNGALMQCFDSNSGDCGSNALMEGVAPSPRSLCYPGFVWVPWRKKCFRKV